MTVELSPRLKTVASFLEGVTLLCDVGSDHAYLPVYAIQQGLITSATKIIEPSNNTSN